jgi:hypothetical protein
VNILEIITSRKSLGEVKFIIYSFFIFFPFFIILFAGSYGAIYMVMNEDEEIKAIKVFFKGDEKVLRNK